LLVGAAAMRTTIDPAIIAPCGMNCALCSGYLALKNDVKNKGIKMIHCQGCRPRNKKCAFLKGHCSKLTKGEVTFCFECSGFPCDRLRTMDNRYRSRYRMSMIENLNFIKENGMEKFLEDQEKTWKCQSCGELISCHNGLCFNCDLEMLKHRQQKYRWDKDQKPK
jgi:hypothetical protein